MLTFETTTRIEAGRARAIFDFLAHPNDRDYRRWWPGVHLAFHPLAGDRVLMDEYIGTRRLRLEAIVVEAVPARRLVWQLVRSVRLPAWVSIDLDESDGGVTVTHRLRAGWRGWGRVLDPLLRRYLSPAFAGALDRHVRTELHRFPGGSP